MLRQRFLPDDLPICAGTPKTCTPLWTAETNTDLSASSPAVAGGRVYVGSDDDNLYAVGESGVVAGNADTMVIFVR